MSCNIKGDISDVDNFTFNNRFIIGQITRRSFKLHLDNEDII